LKLYVAKGPVPEEAYRIPLGVAEVRRAGSDVTIVAISAMVERALEAAELLTASGTSAEVIDPRTLSPLDVESIVTSVEKTGALWNRMRDSFGAGYRLVLVDLRGAGRSHELERTDLSLARWADDLAEVVRELELDEPVLVGHSLGASIVLKYALERPGEAGALVLIGAEANLSNLATRM